MTATIIIAIAIVVAALIVARTLRALQRKVYFASNERARLIFSVIAESGTSSSTGLARIENALSDLTARVDALCSMLARHSAETSGSAEHAIRLRASGAPAADSHSEALRPTRRRTEYRDHPLNARCVRCSRLLDPKDPVGVHEQCSDGVPSLAEVSPTLLDILGGYLNGELVPLPSREYEETLAEIEGRVMWSFDHERTAVEFWKRLKSAIRKPA